MAFLVVAACGYLALEPWHGPTVLALSSQHGIDAFDLPAVTLLGLVVAVWHAQARTTRPKERWWRRERTAALAVIALGAVLLVGIFNPRVGDPLVPAGGGTFNRGIHQVDGQRAEPVGRWTHLALTYDGTRLRLYVDGTEVSSASASGVIARTADPLWLGGNRPYGEFFRGVIDEVRVYDRALGSADVRREMSTPIASRGAIHAPGIVAAYSFDAATGQSVADATGNGNTGAVHGAKWTNAGRFGRGMMFNGAGDVIRVPASASLNLRSAMTLMAWIKPSESQSGWRTVLARQTDVYYIAAGGGREDASLLETLDRVRFALVLLLAASIGLALGRTDGSWATSRRLAWYLLVPVFVVGSVADASFAPSDTLIGPALVAVWCGATAAHGDDRKGMYVLSAVFATVTVLSIAGVPLPLPNDDGGVVRAAALGLLLAATGLSSLRRARRDRDRSGALGRGRNPVAFDDAKSR